MTKKTRILDVVYNASNNELVRTKTLVKGAIVQIDPTPFKAWFEQHYRVSMGSKQETGVTEKDVPEARAEKVNSRRKALELDPKLRELIVNNRVLARISSRPGQSGRADGYILEGEELEFYLKALNKKKGKKSA